MKVFELENILQDALNELEGHNEDETLVVYPMTYGVNLPFVALRDGYVSLKTIETEEEKMSAESLNERKGGIRKYRGCKIHDMGDVLVATDEYGNTLGQERTELGAEAIIDDYLDKKIEKKGFTVTEENENFETIFNNIFPFASINDEFARETMFKIGKVVYKYLSKDCVGDCFFLLQSILKKLLKIIFGRPGDRRVEVMYDTIDNYIMSRFDDEDLGTRCVRDVLTILED